MRVFLVDRASYQVTSREYTDEGYLRVPGRVARTGVQQYRASDIQITDGDTNRIVNVYRPPDEVFRAESLATYQDCDAVNDHPRTMVDAESFKSVSVGHVSGPATRDGDYVLANLIIKDKSAIRDIESGKTELSAGYEAEYIRDPGVTEDGTEYEYIQRNIKINHVALVDRARAGPQAKLFDHHHQEHSTMPAITLDGRTVEVADASTATLITDIFDRKDKEIQRLTSDMEKTEKERDKAQAEKDAKEEEFEKLKKKSSDSAIQDRLTEVVAVVADAKIVAGAEFTADGVDVMKIRRAAIAVCRDSVDWPSKSDAYVTAAFDIACESKKEEMEDEEEEKKSAKKSTDGFVKDMSTYSSGEPKPSPRENFITLVADGWKKTVGEDA